MLNQIKLSHYKLLTFLVKYTILLVRIKHELWFFISIGEEISKFHNPEFSRISSFFFFFVFCGGLRATESWRECNCFVRLFYVQVIYNVVLLRCSYGFEDTEEKRVNDAMISRDIYMCIIAERLSLRRSNETLPDKSRHTNPKGLTRRTTFHKTYSSIGERVVSGTVRRLCVGFREGEGSSACRRAAASGRVRSGRPRP